MKVWQIGGEGLGKRKAKVFDVQALLNSGVLEDDFEHREIVEGGEIWFWRPGPKEAVVGSTDYDIIREKRMGELKKNHPHNFGVPSRVSRGTTQHRLARRMEPEEDGEDSEYNEDVQDAVPQQVQQQAQQPVQQQQQDPMTLGSGNTKGTRGVAKKKLKVRCSQKRRSSRSGNSGNLKRSLSGVGQSTRTAIR
jgi:hypothetical protein